MLRVARLAALVAVAATLAIQLVPYGREHTAPPLSADAPWPSARAERLARQACYSCHSNETEWPLYASVAPFSWLTQRDVDRGRDELNFSEWDRDAGEADDAAEVLADGEMPPRLYTLVHPEARLTDEERRVLIQALIEMEDD